MGFQKTVLIVALVILTLSIIVMGTIISKNESSKKWPPEVSTCPPYYSTVRDTSTSVLQCKLDSDNPNAPKVNPNKENNCTNGTVFNLQENPGNTIISEQDRCIWANNCGIVWDGISHKDCSTRNNQPEILNEAVKN
jgi:hypothetical protein